MQNYINAKTDNGFINKLNTLNLTALAVFLIYLFSATLVPIVNSIINARNNNLFISQKSSSYSYAQALKLKTNVATTTSTVTYINQGQTFSRQIDNNNLQSYISDTKRSVLKLNSSDKSQDQIYNYDAYGKPIANTIKPNLALSVSNPFQYNGERTDNNTALQYLRARFYNPETKRFINQDSYNLLNRFEYVNSNPVMGVDPTGHDAADQIKDAWNNATNGISSAFGTNSTWSQVILGAAIGVTSLAGTYGAYRFGRYSLSKYRSRNSSKPNTPVASASSSSVSESNTLQTVTISARSLEILERQPSSLDAEQTSTTAKTSRKVHFSEQIETHHIDEFEKIKTFLRYGASARQARKSIPIEKMFMEAWKEDNNGKTINTFTNAGSESSKKIRDYSIISDAHTFLDNGATFPEVVYMAYRNYGLSRETAYIDVEKILKHYVGLVRASNMGP